MRKSVAQSRLASGRQTPRNEDFEHDSNLSSPLFSSSLQERLKQVDDKIDSEAATARNKIIHSIEVLSSDRRKTSELAREQALAILLREVVTKFDPTLVNYELFSEIVQSFNSSRSPVEAMTALQLVCACLALIDSSEDERADDCFDLVKKLVEKLRTRMSDTGKLDVTQTIVTSYAYITYYMNAGGGGYGVEAKVSELMEQAESHSGEEADIVATALGGAALLVTLTSGATTGTIASEWLYTIVPMLDSKHLPTRLAAAKFLAVVIERCNRSVLLEEDNKMACDDIVQTLDLRSQESTSKTSKREKKVQNLLFKSVSRFITAKLEGEEGSDLDSDNDENLVSQYHKNTVRKSMGVTTWSSLIVVEHLNWVYGPGLQTQLSINPSIQALLKKEELTLDSQGFDSDNESEDPRLFNTEKQRVDAVKKSRNIRKEQLRKAEERGLAEE